MSLAILLSLAGTLVLQSADPDLTKTAQAMVDAERKFYLTGQKQGTRAAFLIFLANDGVVFRPGPVNGQEFWGKRPETGFDLIWEPAFATIARSANFGYTTGPAKWRANKEEKTFAGHGHFISIWKNRGDGTWKVELDVGIEHPAPVGEAEALRIVELSKEAPGQGDSRARRSDLQKAQNAFVVLAKLDFTRAFGNSASDEVRLYRDGSFPALGKNAAAQLLGTEQAGVALEVMGGDISASADLAYHYGKYSDTRPQGAKTGHFFQIWQTDTAGTWKLVLDWQQALPKN